MKDNGFNQDGDRIEGFSAKCEKCGSQNVKIEYEFTYYGGYTGWDQSLELICEDCDNTVQLSCS